MATLLTPSRIGQSETPFLRRCGKCRESLPNRRNATCQPIAPAANKTRYDQLTAAVFLFGLACTIGVMIWLAFDLLGNSLSNLNVLEVVRYFR